MLQSAQMVKTITVPTKREPSTKQLFKRKAKCVVSGIAKSAFGGAFKTLQIKNRPRKAELIYKLKISGESASESISKFNQMIAEKARNHYLLSFSGRINPRTAREEMFIELVLFGDSIAEGAEADTRMHTFVKSRSDIRQELENIHHEI